MAKFSINTLLHLRRSYAVLAAENVRVAQQTATSSAMKAASATSSSSASTEEKKEVFWMRDPETGYWIPESHFGEVDVADLRAKLLSKKNKF